jgi:hypothetical protein
MRVRDGIGAPRCPFCGATLQRPAEIAIGEDEQGLGGACSCGAVYTIDPTGKNVGLLISQALNVIAEKLGKDVGDLIPDEDYVDAILSYDWRTHRSTGVSVGYMDGYGRLYIYRLRKIPES